MANAEALEAVIGLPVDSDAVSELIEADGLILTTDEDLEEGESVTSHMSNPVTGYALQCRDGRISAAFLFATPTDGYAPFATLLPGGLLPLSTRQDVLHRFGRPERSGEAFTDQFLGRQGAWDRFMIGSTCVHFQYVEPDDRVRLVTLMAASEAP